MYLPRLRRPHYADIAATLALFFALSGTAYAVPTVNTDDIFDGAVTTAKLHDLAVTSAKLGGQSVTAAKIQTGAVSSGKLAPGAVTSDKLAPGAVASAALGAGSVTNAKLADASVSSAKLADGSVTHSKIGANSITGGNVASDSLSLADLKGINQTGFISLSVGAHACGKLTFTVSGAVSGQAAVLTWQPTGDSVPTQLVIGPLEVVNSTTVIGYACNMGATTVSRTHLGVRIVTFG